MLRAGCAGGVIGLKSAEGRLVIGAFGGNEPERGGDPENIKENNS